jgi:glycosyltransferase involved in cell wall biosynthesis
MKIIFIIPGLFHSGGINVIKKHCKLLNARGHDCQMWYPVRRFRGYFYKYAHVYCSIKQIPPADVVIATSWETAGIVNSLNKQKQQNKKYFIQHYEQWDYHNGEGKVWEIDDTYTMDLQHIYVSEFIKKQIPTWQNGDNVVHNGVDLPYKFDKDYSVPRILYPVSDVKWKGNSTLEPVMKRIKEEHTFMDIQAYGKPFVSEEEKQKLLTLANIFVFPSWIEGFGLPPLEAAAYGCAVISTTTNAMPEIFQHNEMRWVPPKNEDELYHAIVQVITNPGLRQYLGEQARWTAQGCTWEKAVNKFEEVLKNE